jgi:predicted 2-oxoglutarate/Fe(II)-dependent dioxygenase YbiX/peroxiredoxin
MSPAPEPRYRLLQAGDPAPWFTQRGTSNASYSFDTTGGRYIVLCLFGSAQQADALRRLDFMQTQRERFDDVRCSFFGVSIDPQDEAGGQVQESLPGVRHFWDFDFKVSRLYGALPSEPVVGARELHRARWVVLNPNLQVRCVLPFRVDAAELPELLRCLDACPPLDRFAGMEMHAPVLLLADVFEPELCTALIADYQREDRTLTGFMREQDGKTVGVHEARRKVRRDCLLNDEALVATIQRRITSKVSPAIRRAFQFDANRMERYLVGCYDGAEGGHFRSHRDNTTRGTAHRRFAMTINLNDAFDGGELVFPEYGPRRYKPPPGAAVIFSCSLLHHVEPVRTGRRFAFLPFLYDDAAALVREANSSFLQDPGGAPYRAFEHAPARRSA